MREFKMRCPRCQKGVRASVSGQQEVVALNCPSCGGAIKFRIPPTNSIRSEPPEPSFTEQPFESLNMGSHDPWQNASRANAPIQYQTGNNHTSRHWNPPVKSRNHLRLFMGLAAVAGISLCILTVSVLLWSFRDSSILGWDQSDAAREDASSANIASVDFPSIPKPESVAAVQREVDALSQRVDQSVAALTESELQTTGADRLLAVEPLFRDLFYRAAQTTPESRSMPEVVERETKLAAELARIQQTSGNTPPPPNYVWRLNSTNNTQDRWGSATYAISSAKVRTETALWSRVRYPDPLKETSEAFAWSAEDRRVLSAYWLQAELERDVTTELIAGLREKQSIKQLQDRCFLVIENFYQPARDLAAVKSTQGSIIIREPKATPYARHAKATRSVLQELRLRLPEENIAWIINQTEYFSDAIEELQFGRTAAVEKFAEYKVRERLDATRKLLEQEQQKKLADAERAKAEKAKQDAELQAKALAEKERQQQLAEAEKNRISDAAASNSKEPEGIRPPQQPIAGGPAMRPFGPGSGRPPIGMGRGSGDPAGVGPPLGPDGAPPPGFGPPPGIAGRNGETPAPQGNPPPGPTNMGPSVTVRITGPSNMNVAAYLEKLKAALKTGNYQSSHSGGEATILLGFAGDLQVVVDAIDFGKVESVDPQRREVRVKIP